MSLLDELFEDLQDDLHKVEQEEQQVVESEPKAVASPSSNENNSDEVPSILPATNNKKPKLMMPTQLIKKKEVVTTAAPTINKEYLQGMFGLDERPSKRRPSSVSTTTIKPSLVLPPIPPQPPPVVSAVVLDLVFQPSTQPSAKQLEESETSKKTDGEYRLFVGNLGTETRDDHLQKIFKEYSTVTSVKVILDATKEKCKGFGFVAFTDPFEMLRALREKNSKLCGNRPMQISKAKGEQHDPGSKRSKG